MTKHEQLLLASAIRLAYDQDSGPDYKVGVQFTAEAISQALSKANTAFDREKFIAMCGIHRVN